MVSRSLLFVCYTRVLLVRFEWIKEEDPISSSWRRGGGGNLQT
jgi:hypothetical protein